MSDDPDRHGEAGLESFQVMSDLAELTDTCLQLMTNCPASLHLPTSHVSSVSKLSCQVSSVREILSRRQYKVVFLGRTSSGKSSLINALLGERVLPTGLGHTTACFIEVEGTEDSEPSLILPHCQTTVRGDRATASALASPPVAVSEDSLLTLQWPRARCPLLQADVVLVDTPGLDVTTAHDHWIDNFCQDSDIFVLVANAESTVMMREKHFFLEVADKISNPNIVIIENRWDCAEFEEEEMIERVKGQHLERCSQFLQQLGVSPQSDVRDRVFFTSGREMLNMKTRGEHFQLAQPSHQFQQRKEDFHKFERILRHHLTLTSLETKYATHCTTGKHICHQLIKILDELTDQTVVLEKTYQDDVDKKTKLIEEYNFEMENITADLREEIRGMMENITQRIAVVLHEEINNLNFLVKDFKLKYSDEKVVNMIYFQEMEKFLEKGLVQNMKSRISCQITTQVQETQENLVMQITEKFPDFQEDFSWLNTKYPPQISFFLSSNSSQDFHYDGTFQFSWGVFYWVREYRGMLSRMFPTPGGEAGTSLAGSQHNVPALSKLAFFLLASQNTMSGMLAGSLFCRLEHRL